ncbi:MAG: hypothetical protein LBS16_02385 [Prevotellaceae bacterium]|nr:hypothetical protein [Prevotellaceae bacterium]
MKTNLFLFAALTAAFLSVANYAAAQVTIGGGDPPKAGAILDLNSTTKGGLVLSNVELTSLTAIPASFPNASAISNPQALAGMMVWNTNDCLVPNGDGLYVWDGNKWNYTGGGDGFFSIPTPTCPNPLPNLIMASYNLGADVDKLMFLYPDLSPAKQQMAYQATNVFSATDATVYGDLYEWGRVADGHEKRDAEPYATAGALESTDLDGNGQVKNDYGVADYNKADTDKKYGHFIKGDINFYYDWCDIQNDDLWGNGVAIDVETLGKGVLASNGQYYQSTDWAISDNNPCPSGWRVPTQDELERLINYDCGTPNSVDEDNAVDINSTTEYYKSVTAGLTWVRVKAGMAYLGNWAEGDHSGYAIYRTDVWTAAISASGYFDNNGTPDYTRPLYEDAAPEPLLFLPAAGYRSANGIDFSIGSVGKTGYIGSYWSSTVIDENVFYLSFIHSSVSADKDYHRAGGFSVRCVKE